MVKPVNGSKTPNGYTAIKLYDTKTKKAQAYYVPVGQKITVNGKTYDPSKGKNNEFVFTGTKGEKGFDYLGASLKAMDVNGDGRIDKNDTDDSLRNKVNKNLPKGTTDGVTQLDPWTDDASVYKGEGYVRIMKDSDKFGEPAYYVEIGNGDDD